MQYRGLFIALGCVAIVGCSDSGTVKPDASTEDADTSCGAGIYPCGPYGTSKDSVAANFEFDGYSDPQNHCKEHKDKVADTSKTSKHSFKDWHLGDASCPSNKKELLWVMVSAGWCNPCKSEVKSVQTDYLAGKIDKRVGIINIVFETDPPIGPATETFTKKWIDSFKLTYPVVMDPKFQMGKYFDKNNAPFNMLIDTKTMKVFHSQTSGSLATIGQKINTFFN